MILYNLVMYDDVLDETLTAVSVDSVRSHNSPAANTTV